MNSNTSDATLHKDEEAQSVNEIRRRAKLAIERFLEYMRIDVVEKDWSSGKNHVDFIGYDQDCLVFIDCIIYEQDARLCEGFPSVRFDRSKHERAALAYLCSAGEIGTGPLRFDCVELIPTSKNQAMIRYRKNVLATDKCSL